MNSDWSTGNQTMSEVRKPTRRSTLNSRRLRSTLAQRLAPSESAKPTRPTAAMSQKTAVRLRSMDCTRSMSSARVLTSTPCAASASRSPATP